MKSFDTGVDRSKFLILEDYCNVWLNIQVYTLSSIRTICFRFFLVFVVVILDDLLLFLNAIDKMFTLETYIILEVLKTL